MPNRIEREIEEILTRLDEFVPDERRMARVRRRVGAVLAALGAWTGGLTRRISGGYVVLAACVVLVLAFFLHSSFPTFAKWATYAGLAVVFTALVLSIRPPRRRSSARYWRGQPVELTRPSPLMRLRMWWRRRNRRGR
ncbi:MAG: hypothetical protein U0531_00915 [Dehalococcoidia bacterium]